MSEYIVRMPQDMPYEIRAELNAWYVESEPIVRCRDCKHYVNGVCAREDDEIGWLLFKVEPASFCSWGIKKSEVVDHVAD